MPAKTPKTPPTPPPTPPAPLVAYYRVSTQGQAASGLGLEGQVAAVEAFARAAGRPLVRSFKETESGKRSDRPELKKALAHARRAGGTLVIAKLDRLARNVHFLSGLMEAKVDFVAVDNPAATPFTLHILAAVAEHEARAISERTKTALAAYKAGKRVSKRVLAKYEGAVPPAVVAATAGKLGSHLVGCHLTRGQRLKGSVRGARATRRAAAADYADLLPEVLAGKAEGLSLAAIAGRLNDAGHATRRGAAFGPMQVKRILDRAASPPAA